MGQFVGCKVELLKGGEVDAIGRGKLVVVKVQAL